MIQYKAVPVTGLKVLDAEQGIVSTLVSVTGIEDEVRDVIEPGAYEKTLAARRPKGVWSHNWDEPISKTLEVRELLPGDPELPKSLPTGDPWPAEAGALKVVTQFNLNGPRGQQAFADVQFFDDEQEWSIGYEVPVGGAKVDPKTGVRRIKDIELYEYSPVLWGAMPFARTQAVKDLPGDREPVREAQEAFKALRADAGTTPHEFRGDGDLCLACGDPDGTKAHVVPETQEKAAIRSHKTSTSDEAWDGDAQRGRLPNSEAPLREAHAWVDPDGDAEAKASYRFIHHFVGGDGEVGAASTTACTTGIGVLNGGRGGTTIPDDDKQGVHAHLAKHLTDAGREPPELKASPGDKDVHSGSVAGAPAAPAFGGYRVVQEEDAWEVQAETGDVVEGGRHATQEAADEHAKALAAGDPELAASERAGAVVVELLPAYTRTSPSADGKGLQVTIDQEGLAKALAERMAEAKGFYVQAAGSYEERMDAVRRSVEAWSYEQGDGDTYAMPEATFEDSVVFAAVSFGRGDLGAVRYYRATYALGDGAAELGEPVEVAVEAAVREKAVARMVEAKRAGWLSVALRLRSEGKAAPEGKAGRVLSASNSTTVLAAVESLLGVLDAAGVEHGYSRAASEPEDKSQGAPTGQPPAGEDPDGPEIPVEKVPDKPAEAPLPEGKALLTEADLLRARALSLAV